MQYSFTYSNQGGRAPPQQPMFYTGQGAMNQQGHPRTNVFYFNYHNHGQSTSTAPVRPTNQMPTLQYPNPFAYASASFSSNPNTKINGNNRSYPQGYMPFTSVTVGTREERPTTFVPPNTHPAIRQTAPTVRSLSDNVSGGAREEDYEDDPDFVLVQVTAAIVGEVGFKPVRELTVYSNLIVATFSGQDKNKNPVRAGLWLPDQYLRKIWLCNIERNFALVLLLTDAGREELNPKLRWTDSIRTYDIAFMLNSAKSAEIMEGFRSKLAIFFGSRFYYVDKETVCQDKKLVASVIMVSKYGKFLEKLERKRDSAAQSALSATALTGSNAYKQGYYSSEPPCTHARRDISNMEDQVNGSEVSSPTAPNVISATQPAPNAHQNRMGISYGDDMFLKQDKEETAVTRNNENLAGGAGTPGKLSNMVLQVGCTENDDCSEQPGEISILEMPCEELLKMATAKIDGMRYDSDVVTRTARSDSNIIDFPEDFLALDGPTLHLEEEKPLLNKLKKPVEDELTLEDDDAEKVELTSLKFSGDVTVNVDSIRQSMPHYAFMTGQMASFYFKHYIPYVVLKENNVADNICFFDSDSYAFIRLRCDREFSSQMYGAVTPDIATAVFGKRRRKSELPPFIKDLIKHEVSIIPIFWDNHWILGLLQLYGSATEDSVGGRLVLVDSMFHDPINKDVLAKISDSIQFHLSIAVKAALIMSPKPRELSELFLIRCDSLPCQDNHSDCGWYMCLYAEYFSRNLGWTNFSNEQLQHISFNVLEDEEFHARLHTIKREVGAYMEKAAGRALNFEYDRVAVTSQSNKAR